MGDPSIGATPMAGKGQRVAGIFLLFLGAAIVLESARSAGMWAGGALALAGAAALVRGLLAARPAPCPRVSIAPQPERRP